MQWNVLSLVMTNRRMVSPRLGKDKKTTHHNQSNPTMSVTKPTLTYFDLAGRAEVARLILEDAGVDYNYVSATNWPALKQQLGGKRRPLPSTFFLSSS
jgi:hypothetical protein